MVALLMAGCGERAEKKAVVEVLAKIKKAKESGATKLELFGNYTLDLSPLAGLTKFESLQLENNEVSDHSPLKGLNPNLVTLHLTGNPIPEEQKAMLKKVLPDTEISFD